MKSYLANFRKKDGSLRNMHFAKLKDLPPGFLDAKVKGKKPPVLNEGAELVWDLDAQEFRVFNWNTALGEIQEKEVNFVL
jgi:hypothetical protein